MSGVGLERFGFGRRRAENFRRGRTRLRRGEGFDVFETHDALVGNFPAEIFLLAALLVMLFEEDGAARIGHESSGGRKANVSGAVLDFNGTAKEGRVTGHTASVRRDSSMVNSTNGFIRKTLWKIVSRGNSFL